MSRRQLIDGSVVVLGFAALAAGCGGGNRSSSAGTTAPATTTAPRSETVTRESGALTAEAQDAAAGDIPDNQVFLLFRNPAEGYSIKYPEGWAQRGAPAGITFRDKNNVVRIEVVRGPDVTVAGAAEDLNRLKRQTPSLHFDPPERTTVSGRPVVKVVYATESTPNPVTGKPVELAVDRYYVPGSGKHAVVDLGTPQGVDNVDAYRLMIASFRWR